MHYDLTDMDIKRPCIFISQISQMFVIHLALPAEGILPLSPISYELGHCDLFSYKTLITILYNSHDQSDIFLFFAVPKNSISFEITGFHKFLQNKVFFRFSYRAQPDIMELFLSNNLTYHPYQYAEIELLRPRCAHREICI